MNDETQIMAKDFYPCELCKIENKGVWFQILYDNTIFVCLHCLIDFLTSDKQSLYTISKNPP